MSTNSLIETLQKMLLLHKSLNELAEQKTKIIKTGDTETLQSLLKEEKKHIQAIQRIETERVRISKEFLATYNQDIENLKISKCINVLSGSEKEELENLKTDLQMQIDRLAQQNKLNQQMLEQSLQFVNISLDILMPEIDTFNYERPGQAYQFEDSRSIFNSKA